MSYPFSRNHERTAQKEHKCAYCGDKIRVGEKHLEIAGSGIDGFYAFRSHETCNAVFESLVGNYDPDDTFSCDELSDMVSTYFEEKFSVKECEKLRETTETRKEWIELAYFSLMAQTIDGAPIDFDGKEW